MVVAAYEPDWSDHCSEGCRYRYHWRKVVDQAHWLTSVAEGEERPESPCLP